MIRNSKHLVPLATTILTAAFCLAFAACEPVNDYPAQNQTTATGGSVPSTNTGTGGSVTATGGTTTSTGGNVGTGGATASTEIPCNANTVGVQVPVTCPNGASGCFKKCVAKSTNTDYGWTDPQYPSNGTGGSTGTGGTTGGPIFRADYACKPNGTKMCYSQTFLNAGPYIHIYGGPVNLSNTVMTSIGSDACIDFLNQPATHVRSSYGASPDPNAANYWAQYGDYAPSFSTEGKRWLEKTWQAAGYYSYGCSAYWSGSSWTQDAGI